MTFVCCQCHEGQPSCGCNCHCICGSHDLPAFDHHRDCPNAEVTA